ncbi:hypothetical protein ACFVWG_10635 [Kribbella sp. NPDC058245]|uniref:hypothetical protein n=1 Tax=Kribbella sp. NPDC058245 TaxID=3346399 RepID=UPI0036E9EF63
MVRQLAQYADPSSDDHLYVLEFQGIRQQYVMFGRTRSIWRRLAAHRQAANPHGFVLLNGWISPGVNDAYSLEQITLGVGGLLHDQQHCRERFYDMPFELGLSIARSVFEIERSHRPRRPRRPGKAVALAAASYHWRHEILAAWERTSTPRQAILVNLSASISAFGRQVDVAEKFWQAAERGQSTATQLHRIASVLSIAESPRTRTQLISALDLPRTRLHMNGIADVLDRYPAFVEPA